MIRSRKCNHSTWESLSHTICFAISISYQHISYLSRIHLCNNLAEYLNRRGSLQWPSFLYFYTPSWGTYQDMCEARLNDCELEDSINSGEIAFLNKENSAERSQARYRGHEGWGGIQLKEAKVPRLLEPVSILSFLWRWLIWDIYSGNIVTDANCPLSDNVSNLKAY